MNTKQENTMMIFNCCPHCKKEDSIEYKEPGHWVCFNCGFDLYNNVAAAVGLIILTENNHILFEVRAKEPRKGFLALPGGFVDKDESAEHAVIRECKEEIGLEPDSTSFICTSPNTYCYKNIEYKTCDMFFVATFSNKDFLQNMKLQKSEVTEIRFEKIETETDIDKLPLAFDSAKIALKIFLKKYLNKNRIH